MKTIDLKQIRSLISATKAGLETTDSQIGWDAWMGSFGEDQLPRLLDALDELYGLAVAASREPSTIPQFFHITNR